MLAPTVLALSLAVRVYDSAGVDGAERIAALAVARDILKDAGIDVAWREATADGHDPCDEPTAPEVILRIVAASPQTPGGSLGYSLVDVQLRMGTLATVFADRVTALADRAGADAGRLLGRVVAHEIGHLLAGTTGHADHGLMRSTFTLVELQQDHPWDWVFRPSDIAGLRHGFLARMRNAEPAPAVVAAKRKRALIAS